MKVLKIALISIISLFLLNICGIQTAFAQEFPESHLDFLSTDSYTAFKLEVNPKMLLKYNGMNNFMKPGYGVGPNVQMNDPQIPFPGGLLGRSETTIASDPSGRFLLSGWNDADGFCGPPFNVPCTPPPTPGLSGYAFSSDGGKTWTDGGAPFLVVTPGGTKVTRGDPWMDTGGDGEKTYYYANLAVDITTSSPGLGGMVVHRGKFSKKNFVFNHGVFLASPNAPNDFLDKEALCAGKTGKTKDWVVVTVTNFIEVSSIPFFGFGQIEAYTSQDRSVSYQRAIVQPDETISVPLNEGIINQGSACAIGRGGEIYVVWERGYLSPFYGQATVGVYPQIVFSGSTDGGKTFSPRILVSDISSGALFPPAGYNRPNHNDFPRIAVAMAGPYKDRIYVTYQDSRIANGGTQSTTGGFGHPDLDIYLRYSDDGGNSWSAATLVAGGGDGNIQFWPVVSSDANGRVNITWNESVESGGTSLVDVYYASSDDGGVSFSSPIKITEVTTDWGATATNIIPNFGDYIFHVSKSNRVMTTWADGRNGVPDAFYATIGVGKLKKGFAPLAGEESKEPQEFSLSRNNPNPFNPTTEISFTLPEETEISLRVFDILGREVANLASGRWTAGDHRVTFDATELPSGIYIYKLNASSFVAVKRMILVK